MAFTIFIDPKAIEDIQTAVDYYDTKEVGLGRKFETALHKHLLTLKRNPFFRIRYENVRCLPMKKYPFMVHYTLDDKRKVVEVRAVFHTSRNKVSKQ